MITVPVLLLRSSSRSSRLRTWTSTPLTCGVTSLIWERKFGLPSWASATGALTSSAAAAATQVRIRMDLLRRRGGIVLDAGERRRPALGARAAIQPRRERHGGEGGPAAALAPGSWRRARAAPAADDAV